MQNYRQLYGRIYRELRDYPLTFNITEGVLFMQSESETVGINPVGERMFITYQTLDKKVAEGILVGCPKPILCWLEKLRRLEDRGNYKGLPFFSVNLDLDDAISVCSFLGEKISSRELKSLN